MTTRTSRARRGFSAVEVLGAVALIGLALVPAMDLVPAGNRQAAITETHVQARALLEMAVDEWIEAAAVASSEPAVERETTVPFARGEGSFRLRLAASEVEGKAGLWMVSAHVEWNSASSKTHELDTARLYCNPHLSLMGVEPPAGDEPVVADEGRHNS